MSTGAAASVLPGHFFAVVHEQADAVLQLVLDPSVGGGWQLLLSRGGAVRAVHAVSSIDDVVVGYAAGHYRQAADPRAPRYHFCCLFDRGGAEPLSLATHTDSERSEARMALLRAQAASLPPSSPVERSGALLLELPGGELSERLAALSAGRLVLFGAGASKKPCALAVLRLTGAAEEDAASGFALRFVVTHAGGSASFHAEDEAARGAWVDAIADAVSPGGRVSQVHELITSAHSEVGSAASGLGENTPVTSDRTRALLQALGEALDEASDASADESSLESPDAGGDAAAAAAAAAGLRLTGAADGVGAAARVGAQRAGPAERAGRGGARLPNGGAHEGHAAAEGPEEARGARSPPNGLHRGEHVEHGGRQAAALPLAPATPLAAPTSAGRAAPRAGVGARLSQALAVASLEASLLTAELAGVDASTVAVGVRLARRMALVAKRGASALPMPNLGAQAGGPAAGGELSGMSEEELRARLHTERGVHSQLIEGREHKVAKWARLLETVALLPAQEIHGGGAAPLKMGCPYLEASLRLGTRFLSAWGTFDDDALQPTPLTIMLDAQCSVLRLLDDGEPQCELPYSAIPDLYAGVRADHFRAARAGAEAAAAARAGVALTPPPADECCFCLPGLPGFPVLPLHVDCVAERRELSALLRGVREGRPPMPSPPLHAGTLMLEMRSIYWGGCYALLLPSHLLLMRSAADAVPFRVLSLHAAAVYHRGGGSLIFSVVSDAWQVNLAAKDLPSCQSWLGALGGALPVSLVAGGGAPDEPPRMRYPRISTLEAELSSTLTRLRVLRRELFHAEGQLRAAQLDADRAVAATIERVRACGSPALRPSRLLASFAATPKPPPLHTGVHAYAPRGPSDQPRPPSGRAAAPSCAPSHAPAAQPASSAETQLRQLLELNGAVRVEVGECEAEINSLQRAVVALSTRDWAWFVRISDCRTLWDVWSRAHALHAHQLAATARRRPPTPPQAIASDGTVVPAGGRPAGEEEPPAASVWSALMGSRGPGMDDTNRSSTESRRKAHDTHDEDWFISWANRIFEL